jgi:hypothetical protein
MSSMHDRVQCFCFRCNGDYVSIRTRRNHGSLARSVLSADAAATGIAKSGSTQSEADSGSADEDASASEASHGGESHGMREGSAGEVAVDDAGGQDQDTLMEGRSERLQSDVSQFSDEEMGLTVSGNGSLDSATSESDQSDGDEDAFFDAQPSMEAAEEVFSVQEQQAPDFAGNCHLPSALTGIESAAIQPN